MFCLLCFDRLGAFRRFEREGELQNEQRKTEHAS